MSEPLYPLGLRLTGRCVLVVGGGTVATRRVPALLAAGAQVVVVSPTVTNALRGLADAGRLRWRARRFTADDLDGVWLVQVAVDDPAAAATISEAAEARRIFCVRADDRTAASAWTPAVARHGPVTVAVLGGGDPRRAASVRDAIRDRLADGTLIGDDPAGTSADGPVDPARSRAEGRAGPGNRPVPEPRSGAPAGAPGRVALVGAGPGEPELITVRGRRLLAEADVVVADRLVPGLLLDELRPAAELIDASKIPYGPARAQEEINHILVDRARAGAAVVRLKGGDPYVFGRGGEEVLACAAAGIPVTVVPGVTSAVAAPAAAGVPVTHRGVAHEFVVVSGHLPPDDPASLVNWSALAALRGTLVILMGLRNLPAIVAALLRHGRSPATPAAVVAEGTTDQQRTVRARLADLPAAAGALRPPAVVVIGEVVATAANLAAGLFPGPAGGSSDPPGPERADARSDEDDRVVRVSRSNSSTDTAVAGSGTRNRASVSPGPTFTPTSPARSTANAFSSVTSSPRNSTAEASARSRSAASAVPLWTATTDSSTTSLPVPRCTPGQAPAPDRTAARAAAPTSAGAVRVCTTRLAGLVSSHTPGYSSISSGSAEASRSRSSRCAGVSGGASGYSAPWPPTSVTVSGTPASAARSARARPEISATVVPGSSASWRRARTPAGSGHARAGSVTIGASTPS